MEEGEHRLDGQIPGEARSAGSAWARLPRMFYEPGSVFRELRQHPSWVPPLLLAMLMTLATQLVVVPHIDLDASVRQALAQRSSSAQMTEQQIDRAVEISRKMARISVFLSPLVVPLILLLIAGIYYLGLRSVTSEVEYKPVFSTLLHAAVPAVVVSSVLMMAVVVQKGTVIQEQATRLVKSNLGALLPASAPKVAQAAASVVDVFNIWQAVLLVLGFEIVLRVSRRRAVTVVAVVWGVWMLARVGWAALQSAM